MKPESPSPYPQVPATCPYPEPTPSSPHDELPLLPNKIASETFLHKSGAVRSVDWIFSNGAPAWRWLGEYV